MGKTPHFIECSLSVSHTYCPTAPSFHFHSMAANKRSCVTFGYGNHSSPKEDLMGLRDDRNWPKHPPKIPYRCQFFDGGNAE